MFVVVVSGRCASQLKSGVTGMTSWPIGPVTVPGSNTRMSASPTPTAVEPMRICSPALAKTWISVRRSSSPPPYELVRHSRLAREPVAVAGKRLRLPAAAAGRLSETTTAEARAVTSRQIAKRPILAL